MCVAPKFTQVRFILLAVTCGFLNAGFAASRVFGDERPHSASAEQMASSGQRIASALAQASVASPGMVVVVYFTPNDRDPAKDHVNRIGRIVDTTANFYQDELERHGFADRRMKVLRDERGRVRIINVVGKEPDANYGKPDGSKIRNEIAPVLESEGIDPSASVLLMFCNLMDYDAQASTISHHSPYYGGGSHLSGNAWQCDSEILDPLRLTDTTPIRDGQYGKITIGKHNSIFIGGVIHELGHALSLPHCRERSDESVRGTALMGSGNRTFGDERRGEGRGTFLTQAHALRLAAHPVFNSRVPDSIRVRPAAEWSSLKIASTDQDQIEISGIVSSSVPVHAVVAYFDPEGGGDYDATTATDVPDSEGRFRMRSGDLRASRSGQLRLLACYVNGTTTTRTMAYRTDANGRPDLSIARLELELAPMIDQLRRRDLDAASRSLESLSQDDPELAAIGGRVLDRFTQRRDGMPSVSQWPSDVELENKRVPLSAMKPADARVGWLRPTYDHVPSNDHLLSVGGDYFARGIYAHAPSLHRYELGGQWKRLTGQCGIQTESFGKVDFEIVGDGQRLWSRSGVTDATAVSFEINVEGVKELRLIVTDGGDGKNGDWGLWIDPTLSR